MKIAMFAESFYPTIDGVVTCVQVSYDALTAAGHEVTIIAPDPGKHGEKSDKIPNVRYLKSIEFKSYKGYYVPIFPSRTVKMLKEINPDVIHIQGFTIMALKALRASHVLGIPTVMTFHTMIGDAAQYYMPIPMSAKSSEKLSWIYLKNLVSRPNVVIAQTQTSVDEMMNHDVTVKELRIIPTGVDTKRFCPGTDGSKIIERYNLDGKKVLICMGRVSFEKGISTIINALPELDENVVLMVCGKGPAMDDLKKQTADMNLENRVIFTGFVPDEEVLQHYAAANLVVTGSRFETQGLAIIEAMATGLPVVCPNARALGDFVKDEVNGFTFEEDCECANAIQRALDTGDSFRIKSRETAKEFSIENAVEKQLSAYEYAIEHKKKKNKNKKIAN